MHYLTCFLIWASRELCEAGRWVSPLLRVKEAKAEQDLVPGPPAMGPPAPPPTAPPLPQSGSLGQSLELWTGAGPLSLSPNLTYGGWQAGGRCTHLVCGQHDPLPGFRGCVCEETQMPR